MQCLANSLNLRLDNRIEKVLVNGRRVTTLSRSDVTARCSEPREDACQLQSTVTEEAGNKE